MTTQNEKNLTCKFRRSFRNLRDRTTKSITQNEKCESSKALLNAKTKGVNLWNHSNSVGAGGSCMDTALIASREKVAKRKAIINKLRTSYEQSKLSNSFSRYVQLKIMIRQSIDDSYELFLSEENDQDLENDIKGGELSGIVQRAAQFSAMVRELNVKQERCQYSHVNDDGLGNKANSSTLGSAASFHFPKANQIIDCLTGRSKSSTKYEDRRIQNELIRNETYLQTFAKKIYALDESYQSSRGACNLFQRYRLLKKLIKDMCTTSTFTDKEYLSSNDTSVFTTPAVEHSSKLCTCDS
ncbi:hypothetical protein GJ496_002912 [Pomphorhynchus laevis]|nr:hypothetical protein GJ496_002912 [Pomphorhynchus laevis]